jgi:RHS repeat-associated protein
MYDATLGRFIQRDPNGATAEDINLYEYADDSPTNPRPSVI